MYAKGEAPSKEVLEKVFVAAIRRMKKVAEEKNLDVWDEKVLKNYWEECEHNEAIDNREGNYSKFDDSFCEMCKVNSGRVINIENKPEGIILELETNKGKQKFIQGKFLQTKIGALITYPL